MNTTHQDTNAITLRLRMFVVWRYGLRLLMWLLIPVACYMLLGRLLVPMVDGQKSRIESTLSQKLGVPVILGEVKASWHNFSPVIIINHLQVPLLIGSEHSPTADYEHSIGSLLVEFDIPRSLWQRELIIEEVSVAEVALHLMETQQGQWQLSGLQANGAGASDATVKFLLSTNKLELIEAKIVLQSSNGAVLELDNLYAKINNSGAGHQLQAQFRLARVAQPIQLQLNMVGEYGGLLEGSAFLDVNQADFSTLLEILPQDNYFYRQYGLGLSGVTGSSKLWIDFSESAIEDFNAQIRDVVINGQLSNSTLELAVNNLDLAVHRSSESQWQIWLEDLQFDWQDNFWPSTLYYAELDLSTETSFFNMSAETLSLDNLMLALDTIALPDKAQQVLNELDPTGRLNNVTVGLGLSKGALTDLDLRANLEGVGVNAWRSAPSAKGVNGYIETGLLEGFVELDSSDFTLYLPKVFSESWHYDAVNTRVHWSYENNKLNVNSSIIDVRNDDLHGRVQFALNNAKNELGNWSSDLTLLVGMMEFDVSKKSAYLPTLSSIEASMTWLTGALESGYAYNSGFMFRGLTTKNSPKNSNTVQSFYQVKEGQLKFLPEWPSLSKITGAVKVDNRNAWISIDSAVLANLELGASTASLYQDQMSNSWLKVDSHAIAGTDAGLGFLRSTVLNENVGAYLLDWQGSGELDIDVALDIALNNPQLENRIEVNVLAINSRLQMSNFKQDISAIDGRVSYSNLLGLNADKLTATMFDSPVEISINSYKDNQSDPFGIMIKSAGHVTDKALLSHAGVPDFVKDVLSFSAGEMDYQASVDIVAAGSTAGELVKLGFQSDLKGLDIMLPPPLTKPRDTVSPLSLYIDYFSEYEVLTVHYNDEMYARVEIQEEEIERGEVYFGSVEHSLFASNYSNAEPGLLVSGELEYFDYNAWEGVAGYFGRRQKSLTYDAQGSQSVSDMVRLVELQIDHFEIYEQELVDVITQVKRSQSPPAWKVYIDNEMIRGDFTFTDDVDKPYEIHLDYLRLPETDAEDESEFNKTYLSEESVDIFDKVDPSELPNIIFSTKELRLGDKRLGRWSFNTRSHNQGLSVTNFNVDMPDFTMSDLQGESGAKLQWHYVNGKHSTDFEGKLQIDDLAEVLPNWGYDANVESKSANFLSKLQWQRSPAAFSLSSLSGEIDVEIKDGRFIDVNTGGARIFGALNFDSLVRRLQLDFSDLYETGLAFDEVSGKLFLSKGKISTREFVSNSVQARTQSRTQFLIDGPSTLIKIDGELDLIEQNVDADLLISIPISQNLAVVAGIIGAWPVAIGTYVAGKIFKDQFAGLTAIRYRLDGPLENLDTGFEAAASSSLSAQELEALEVNTE